MKFLTALMLAELLGRQTCRLASVYVLCHIICLICVQEAFWHANVPLRVPALMQPSRNLHCKCTLTALSQSQYMHKTASPQELPIKTICKVSFVFGILCSRGSISAAVIKSISPLALPLPEHALVTNALMGCKWTHLMLMMPEL